MKSWWIGEIASGAACIRRNEKCKLKNAKCKLGKILGVGDGGSAKMRGGLGGLGGLARILGKFAGFKTATRPPGGGLGTSKIRDEPYSRLPTTRLLSAGC
jgi:hypothetical protein